MKSEHLFSVSPLDGRYNQAIEEFREVTSEYGLIKYRVIVEIKWFIHLSKISKIKELPKLNIKDTNYLIDLIRGCSEVDKKIMFVGHNPALHLVFEELSQSRINKYPTCSFSSFSLNTNWDKIAPEKCKLRLSVKPKDLINEN